MRLAPVVLIANVMLAQVPTTPVVTPRGVVNALSKAPAPSVVGPGGWIEVTGLNLGPVAGWKAETTPLPTQYGEEPGWQVLINNRPAGILEAGPSRVLAQVPPETPGGLANVVIRRGNQQSRPARITVQAVAPALEAANGRGYGVARNDGSTGTLLLSATSLGPEAARAAIRVTVGGIAAEAEATPSIRRPGSFEVAVKVPGEARAGDLVLLGINNAESNSVVMGELRLRSEVVYLPFEAGTPELRTLRSSDVDGMNLIAVGARSAAGCYPAYQLDARAGTVKELGGCPTTQQAQAPTPFVESPGSAELATLEGADRKEVRVFRPLGQAPLQVALPEAANNLVSQPGGQFVAVAQGKSFRVNGRTGEVEEFVPGGAAGAAITPQQLLQRFQNLDLGDGITRILSPLAVANNQVIFVAGDSLTQPTKAKVVSANGQGEVTAQRDLPEGWLPIVAPAPPQLPPNAIRTPAATYWDPQTRSYYVVVRNGVGKHALAYFPPEGAAQLIETPENWYFASCAPNLPVFPLELTRAIALLGAASEERSLRNPCPADGFLLLDLGTRRLEAVALPGSGKLNASGGADEINDFLTGANFAPANRNTSDTFYALDGANATVIRFDLPAGVNNFSGGVRVPALNLVVALANNRLPGDAGIVLFDLERTEARLLPTPEGFVSINFLGVLPATRKLVARGVRTGNAGAQLLVFDLENGDLEVIANQEGIAWIGPPPQQPPQPAPQQPVRLNAKSGTVEAFAYGADRRMRGVVVIRIN